MDEHNQRDQQPSSEGGRFNEPAGGSEQTEPSVSRGNTSDEHSDTLLGVLAYLSILFLVPLLLAKDSSFAQYHAKQGAALFVVQFVTMMIMVVPVIGWIIGFLVWILWIILAFIGIMNALQGKRKPLPFTGELAKHF
ncbi:MAG: DUF4870 domain-containing protein [Candidatus Paceibacterota bacterium]